MKKYISVISLLLFMATGCSKMDNNTNVSVLPEDKIIRIGSTSLAQTRASASGLNYATLRNVGFGLNVSVAGGDTYNNVKASFLNSAWNVDEIMYWGSDDDGVEVSAYGPYIENFTGDFTVQTDQTTEENFTKSDFAYAKSVIFPNAPDDSNDIYYYKEKINVDLNHILSRLEVTVKIINFETNPITELWVEGANTTATISLEDGSISSVRDVASVKMFSRDNFNYDWLSKTSTSTYESILVPQTFEAGELVVVAVFSSGYKHKWFNTSTLELKSGTRTTFPVEITI